MPGQDIFPCPGIKSGRNTSGIRRCPASGILFQKSPDAPGGTAGGIAEMIPGVLFPYCRDPQTAVMPDKRGGVFRNSTKELMGSPAFPIT